MKKAILALFVILACACSKESQLEKGIYYAYTVNGNIYLELLSNGKCIGYFQGGEESGGSYSIDGDRISVYCSVEYGSLSSSRYRYYSISGEGEITNSTSFNVPCEEIMNDKKQTLYFSKR